MRLLEKREVMAMLRVSERTVENMVEHGDFPPPARIGKRVFWAEEVVERWLAARFERQHQWTPPRVDGRRRHAGD